MTGALVSLTEGMPILWGGDRMTPVPADLAARFKSGDRLLVVQTTGDLLHIPRAVHALVVAEVDLARAAFEAMGAIGEDRVTDFFEAFAQALESETVWAEVARANAADVADALRRGRSTTRLRGDEAMRRDMIAGLRVWRDASGARARTLERVDHDGWSVEQFTAPLGVVGFVFEGRLNVFADAAGVLRGGSTVVFRIGSDALGAARAMRDHALAPALHSAGLPAGAVRLIDSPDRAAGHALFADERLGLAVARGSGPAVAQLGAVARQTGTPVSLHGTGGAWLIADASADRERFAAAVLTSLDRKVCNTLNVCCIVASRAADLTPIFLNALTAAGERRGHGAKLHILQGAGVALPGDWTDGRVTVRRGDAERDEASVESLAEAELGREWEWEETPEVTLAIVADLDEAIRLFNRHSPRFIASLIAADLAARARFEAGIEAPFLGDGFTRWVDGQYALGKPELGLSNWQAGRLFARGGVLSGDGVFSVQTRMTQARIELGR